MKKTISLSSLAFSFLFFLFSGIFIFLFITKDSSDPGVSFGLPVLAAAASLVFFVAIFFTGIENKGQATEKISNGPWKLLFKEGKNLLMQDKKTDKIFFFSIDEKRFFEKGKEKKEGEGEKEEKGILSSGESFSLVKDEKNYMVFFIKD